MPERVPVIDGKFIIPHPQSKKPYVLYGGLLDAAHTMGLRGITTTLVQAPSDLNGHLAIVWAQVEMEYGTFTAYGDANPGNVNKLMTTVIIRIAETRAKARALRDAVNAGMYEEEVPDHEIDRDTGEITPKAETNGSSSPSPTSSAPRTTERVPDPKPVPPALVDARKRWGLLVERCKNAGWTLDPKESIDTGKPLIPVLFGTPAWDRVDLIRIEGKNLQDRLTAATAPAEGDSRA